MKRHEHEKWQLRDSPDGGRHCAACGDRVDEDGNTVETVWSLGVSIPANVAQKAVIRALRAAGSQAEWDSETIEHVLSELRPCLEVIRERVPDPFNATSDEDVEFWENLR
jgi:hypothetical protein